jgi:hypothetical protein
MGGLVGHPGRSHRTGVERTLRSDTLLAAAIRAFDQVPQPVQHRATHSGYFCGEFASAEAGPAVYSGGGSSRMTNFHSLPWRYRMSTQVIALDVISDEVTRRALFAFPAR